MSKVGQETHFSFDEAKKLINELTPDYADSRSDMTGIINKRYAFTFNNNNNNKKKKQRRKKKTTKKKHINGK